jgi:mono/diheme cytochrome c family protein
MTPRLRLALVLLLVAGLVLLGARAMHRRDLGDRLMRADPESVLADPTLAGFALEQGKAGFAAHCATCHGTGKGTPRAVFPI